MQRTLYCHTNRVNGKCYVGQTVDTMDERWREHLSAAKANRGSPALGAAIRKYGADVFAALLAACASDRSPQKNVVLLFLMEGIGHLKEVFTSLLDIPFTKAEVIFRYLFFEEVIFRFRCWLILEHAHDLTMHAITVGFWFGHVVDIFKSGDI